MKMMMTHNLTVCLKYFVTLIPFVLLTSSTNLLYTSYRHCISHLTFKTYGMFENNHLVLLM